MKRLANDLMSALDTVSFARRFIDLDPWQEKFIGSESSRIILNCSRQSGKSTTAALLSLHEALYKKHLVLLLSPSLRQSQELFRKVLDMLRGLEAPPIDAESKLRLEFKKGGRIISLPGKEETIRGYSGVDLLIVDEASRVEEPLYFSVRPMLAVSKGRICLLSTPFGNRGFFYREWNAPGWEKFEVPASMCPRIPAKFLEEERASMGAWWFEQEYNCQFLDATSQAFSLKDVENAFSEEVEEWEV